jgi:CRISPR/Cas system CSM-associated protein Csm2 small subunit
MDGIIGRIERAVNKLDKSGGGDEGGVSPAVAGHQEFVKSAVQPFIDAVNKFPELKKVADWTHTVFQFEETVIEATSVAAKPDDSKFVSFLAPISKVVSESSNPDNRSPFFNHLKAFAEIILAANWVTQPGPKAAITAQLEAADFYLNKILTVAKDKPDPEKTNHREYVRLIKNLVAKLAEYADEYFKTGLTWKHGGVDLATFKPGQKASAGGTDSKKTPESRLEAVAARLERLAAKEDKGSAGGVHPAVAAYDELTKNQLAAFLATCNTFPALKQVHDWTKAAYDYQGKVILASTVSAKPSDAAFMKFLAPISKIIEDSGKIDNKSEFFPHLKSFNETISALSWVMQPGPKAVITAQLEAGDFYFNKILVLAKGKTGAEQENHRNYVKNLKALLTALADYANDNFKMGLTWKAGGAPLENFKV